MNILYPGFAALMPVVAAITISSLVFAEDASMTLASTMDVYVFPVEGQASDQQSKEEAECYQWATGNTGVDPFDLSRQAQADQQQAAQDQQAAQTAGQGRAAAGALRGAAAGALIGEIVNDDAGDGAAWGAAAGIVHGRRSGRRAQQQAEQETSATAEKREAETAEQLQNFKKAFSVCLEAKDYMVKF